MRHIKRLLFISLCFTFLSGALYSQEVKDQEAPAIVSSEDVIQKENTISDKASVEEVTEQPSAVPETLKLMQKRKLKH